MQIQIDFQGKKYKPLTFRATDDLQFMLATVTKKRGFESLAALIEEYCIEGVTRDMGKLLLAESRKGKTSVTLDTV
jgi:hypothetical protein